MNGGPLLDYELDKARAMLRAGFAGLADPLYASANNATGRNLIVYSDIEARHHEQVCEHMRAKCPDFDHYRADIAKAFDEGLVKKTGKLYIDYENAYSFVKRRQMEQQNGEMESVKRRAEGN